MTREITVFKAQDTVRKRVPSLRIMASRPFPDFESGDKARDEHQSAAEVLCDALYDCLPGGTMDRLLCEMLKRKASDFVVTF